MVQRPVAMNAFEFAALYQTAQRSWSGSVIRWRGREPQADARSNTTFWARRFALAVRLASVHERD